MKRAALRGALSDRARNDRVHVVTSLVTGDTPSARDAAATLAKVSTARHVLVVAERTDELTWRSLRNVPTVHLLEPGQLNTYDVLISDDVVFTQDALAAFVAGPATGKSAKGAATSEEVAEAPAVDTAKKSKATDAPAVDTAKKTKATEAAVDTAKKPKADEAPAVDTAKKTKAAKPEPADEADEADEEA
jgi:large subunit ribosomal protein L4